jgi:hypothetical protein
MRVVVCESGGMGAVVCECCNVPELWRLRIVVCESCGVREVGCVRAVMCER